MALTTPMGAQRTPGAKLGAQMRQSHKNIFLDSQNHRKFPKVDLLNFAPVLLTLVPMFFTYIRVLQAYRFHTQSKWLIPRLFIIARH